MKDGQRFFINGRFKKADTLFLYRPSNGSYRDPILGRSQIYLHCYDIDRYRVRYGAFGHHVFRSDEKFAILTQRIASSIDAVLKDGNLVISWPSYFNITEPETVVGIVMPQCLDKE